MARSVFDRETLLDISVNIIPLGIILFFITLFLVYSPWGWDPFTLTLTLGLHVMPFVTLALITYVGARYIEANVE